MSNERKKNLAVYGGVVAALIMVAVVTLVVPRLSSADITGPPGTVPTTTLNLFNTQTITALAGFSNTVEVCPIPSGYLPVKREINIAVGSLLGVTNVSLTGAAATNTISGSCVLTNSDGGTTGWIALSQSPYYDASRIYGYSGLSNAICVFRTHIIAVPAPSPAGGSYPTGAGGYGNIGVQ